MTAPKLIALVAFVISIPGHQIGLGVLAALSILFTEAFQGG